MIWKESIKYGDILCGNSIWNIWRNMRKNRIFCRHGIDHLMDVARIAYIENLEKKLWDFQGNHLWSGAAP